MRVLVIIPYFGRWPKWIAYFLQSCAYNPSIQWLLYTDCPEPAHLPENIIYESGDLASFNKMASNQLDMDIACYHPYKICDLRPAFGKIFSDYLDVYDFWGYADLDLIFGNISSFVNENLLEEYDVISVRRNYFAGHFALYKNRETTNLLYSRSDRYRQIFQDASHHYAYDERSNLTGRKLPTDRDPIGMNWMQNFIFTLFSRIRLKLDPAIFDTAYPDMTAIMQKASTSGEIRWYHQDLVRSDLWYWKRKIKDWQVVWKNGNLKDSMDGEELLHFHFLKSKHNDRFKIDPWQDKKAFRIRPAGISMWQDRDQDSNR